MGFGLFVVFAIIGVAISMAQKHTADRTWSVVGRRAGLATSTTSLFGGRSMSGTIRGVHVDARVVTRGSGDSQHRATRYTVTFPSVGPPVTLRRQGVGSFFRGLIGGNDAVVGDPRFDAAVEVDAPDAVALREFLTPARRAAILGILSTWPRAEITNTSIVVETRRVERNEQRMMAALNRLVDSARLLSDPDPVDRALERSEAGDLADAAAALHEAVTAEPEPNVVTRVLEAETLIALDRAEEAKPILAEAATELPGDPEVDGWAAVADEQIERHQGGAAAPTAPEPPPTLDVQATIDDLFGSELRGPDIERRFADRYAGANVTWSGEVESVRAYRFDRDFGDGPGAKTTVRLGSVGESPLMSNRVKAVVDLPSGFRAARGDEVTFAGTLLRVDRFTRTIYVADATPA